MLEFIFLELSSAQFVEKGFLTENIVQNIETFKTLLKYSAKHKIDDDEEMFESIFSELSSAKFVEKGFHTENIIQNI